MSCTYANLPIEQVRANPENARTHSKKQIRQIANSIHKLGFGAPILVDEYHVLIAGHGRLEAADSLGMELGRHGRNRSNVWQYAGANTFRAGRLDDLRAHPTVKPVAMIADAMKDCTRRRRDRARQLSADQAQRFWRRSAWDAAGTALRLTRGLSMWPCGAGRRRPAGMPFTPSSGLTFEEISQQRAAQDVQRKSGR